MKYPKINTLWKREMGDKNKGKIIEGDYSKDEFQNIKLWDVTEKIDGTNIRIIFENKTVTFGGRTDNAQIPATLYQYLQNTFTVPILQTVFPEANIVILFGEGYGSKIHKGGGLYRKNNAFILFDVWVGGWWLTFDSVVDVAKQLKINHVPYIGQMDIETIINFVKSAPNSMISEEPKIIEGIVARSCPLMLFRDGTPLVWKLKVRDFK